MDDEQFEDVVIDSRKENACSPVEPEGPFLGIMIQAPRKVAFKKDRDEHATLFPRPTGFAKVPICGFFMVPGVVFEKYVDVLSALRIVAVNKVLDKVFTGYVANPMPSDPVPIRPDLTPEQLANIVSGGYFNPNLTERVPLPQVPAVYEVHVELGEKDSEDFMESNRVIIELVKTMKE